MVAKFTFAACIFVCCAAAMAVLWALARVPSDDIATVAPSVLVEAASGEPMGRVGPLADAVNRHDIPETLVKAVLSIEDRRFYHHYGVDPLGRGTGVMGQLERGGNCGGGQHNYTAVGQNAVRRQRAKLRS